MEVNRYCIECKHVKLVNEFERFGRTYRRVCRACRGVQITGMTTANVAATVQNVIQQQNTSLTESVSRTETHVQDIITLLQRQQEERVELIESELALLKTTNQQLITMLTQQTNTINTQIVDVLAKIDDVIVMCRDPTVQNEIKAIGNAITVIHNNTKQKATSPVASPAASPSYR